MDENGFSYNLQSLIHKLSLELSTNAYGWEKFPYLMPHEICGMYIGESFDRDTCDILRYRNKKDY